MKLAKYCEAVIQDMATAGLPLSQRLREAKVRGYAYDGEERNIGMRCIAAPVFNVFGEVVAGISVSGPTARITDDRVDALAADVMDAAARLTHAIGGNSRPPG